MTDEQKKLLIRIKGLLMLAVDLIDRECKLGKYAKLEEVVVNAADSIAGIIPKTTEGVGA